MGHVVIMALRMGDTVTDLVDVPIMCPSQCQHVDTICGDCADSWSTDWDFLHVPEMNA